MKLNIWAFGSAVGIAVAAAFTICAFFVAVAPDATGAVFSYLLHIDLTGLVRPISWGGFVAGLVTVGVGTALCASVVAWLYNRMA